MPRLSFEGKLATLLVAALLLGAALGAGVAHAVGSVPLAIGVAVGLGIVPLLWLARIAVRPLRRMLRGLREVVARYRDGEFNVSLVVDRNDELGELLTAHNELGAAIYEQRSDLLQRMFMLDTVTENSPVALVLVDSYQRVVYANLAARHLLSEGRSLAGQDFSALLQRAAEPLRLAASAGTDNLFAAEVNGSEEMFHLSQRSFMLQGRAHKLYLLKTLTRELSRQEVATWKKLIRVLSHELNNSLAPIASMAHSGAEMVRRGESADLNAVFGAIRERAAHLHQFISAYAAFAKLPAPRPERVVWATLIDKLAGQIPCRIAGALPSEPGWFDRAQLEQALINLLKNAHEAGGSASEVEVAVNHLGAEQCIEVRDRGQGMSENVLPQALLPFYSTKRTGTGLGLALAREIAEAHGGRIRLANREGGGFCATLILPLPGA